MISPSDNGPKKEGTNLIVTVLVTSTSTSTTTIDVSIASAVLVVGGGGVIFELARLAPHITVQYTHKVRSKVTDLATRYGR